MNVEVLLSIFRIPPGADEALAVTERIWERFVQSQNPALVAGGSSPHSAEAEVRGDRPGVSTHREKVLPRPPIFPFSAMVARPVGKTELLKSKEALAAYDKEWSRLREKKVWDESVVRELSDVAREAREKKTEIHFGNLFGICVEKGSELPKGHKDRKYKYRVVFQGNRVKNQDFEQAFFMDLGNAPAPMDASRAVDAYGCFRGNSVTLADAVQAYVQAVLKGTETWIILPPEQRPAGWSKFRTPVVRLRLALYGHPDSGTFWEEHCDEQVKKVGFRPVGPEWPSAYVHDELKLFLIIYVDDFKLAGPTENLSKGWKLLRKHIDIEEEKDGGVFLGCNQERSEITLPNAARPVR